MEVGKEDWESIGKYVRGVMVDILLRNGILFGIFEWEISSHISHHIPNYLQVSGGGRSSFLRLFSFIPWKNPCMSSCLTTLPSLAKVAR